MSRSRPRNSNGSRRPGPTGPRTRGGKRRSAQNASKHNIFAKRILPDEVKEAHRLFAQFVEDLRPQTSLELEKIGDLVQNRLQTRRIDKYVVQEFAKAEAPSLLESADRLDARYRSELFCAAAPQSVPRDAAHQLHPRYRIWFLAGLKAHVEKDGAQPDSDLAALDTIYGDALTANATEIVRLYKILKLGPPGREEGDGASERASLQAHILEQLEREIAAQTCRWELEQKRDEVEIMRNSMVLLPEPLFTRIERYRSENTREFERHLGVIERIRRLRKPAADAPSD